MQKKLGDCTLNELRALCEKLDKFGCCDPIICEKCLFGAIHFCDWMTKMKNKEESLGRMIDFDKDLKAMGEKCRKFVNAMKGRR